MNSKIITIIIGLVYTLLSACSLKTDYNIIIPDEPTPAEMLASKEIRRYIYLRTDELLPIIQNDSPVRTDNCIIVASKDRELLKKYDDLPPSLYSDLNEQEYILKSVSQGNHIIHFIIGGDPAGVLYGTYQFAEKLGIRFYLHGDVIPDEKQMLDLPVMSEKGKPLFTLRGILPFHDFPEGPDWWNLEEYKAIIGQLPRLKMNFIGFHTYPEVPDYPSGYCQAEPLVWIGTEKDINSDGSVQSAYPVLHFNTGDNTWGYRPMKTSEFHCGAAELFEQDYFGASYVMNTSQWPRSEQENIRIFNQMGELLEDAFSFARQLDVKTCLGTETPLTVPANVSDRLKRDGIMPGIKQVKELYKGIFQRIIKTHPLDYFWLWTPEGWTWSGTTAEEIKITEQDLLAAVSALMDIRAPFTMATCGWVLGPPDEPTRFDDLLPKNIPFSCINREVGFSPVEPSFASLTDRPKWAIPWMEDDPALISPQLWAGRMRKDAADALKYGCDGLMGIHWRTKILGPNVSALASAGWSSEKLEGKDIGNAESKMDQVNNEVQQEQKDITKDSGNILEEGRNMNADGRDLPADDFYKDWTKSQFGPEASDRIAGIFVSLDGGPMYNKEQDPGRRANFFRIADWQGGPGGILIHKQSWKILQKKFAFIGSLERIRPEIKGKGNLERFDYWLNTFRYAKSVVHFGCIMGQVDSILGVLSSTPDKLLYKENIEQQVLPLRIQASMTWVEMMNDLLQTVSTTGELGTIANLEQHNLGLLQVLNKHDSLILSVTGKPLPPEAELSMKYFGPMRIIVPAVRNLLETGEDFNLKVILLSGEPIKEASFYWKNLGEKQFNKISLTHVSRGVYTLEMPSEALSNEDFEYYIEAVSASEAKAFFPATAPSMNQTIVFIPQTRKQDLMQ
jgi:hypothetical protein